MGSRHTIGTKLVVGVAASVLSLAVLSATSLWVISVLGGSLDEAVNLTARKLELLGRTRDAFQELKNASLRAQVAYSIGEMGRSSETGAYCVACHTPPAVEDTVREIETAGAEVRELSGELRQLISDASDQKTLEAFEGGASHWVDYTKQYLDFANSDRFEDAHTVLRDRMFPILAETEMAAKQLAQREEQALAASNQQAQKTISSGRWTVFVVIGFSLFVAGAVFWLVFRITAALRQIVVELSSGADQVAAAAREVSSGSQVLAQGATEQAASIEETSASSHEINSMARANSDNCREAADLASGSLNEVTEAVTALGDLEAAMGKIGSSSDKIAQTLKVIDDIAFQTNILALNAAVEAARAGDAGSGFSVVADEVRALAQRCAEAAGSTSVLIEEALGNSRHGKKSVERVAVAIHTISEQSGSIKTLVDEVNNGSKNQTAGIAEISRALTQMEQVTQNTAATAEESAAVGEQLSAQSQTLNGMIRKLRTMVDSRKTG